MKSSLIVIMLLGATPETATPKAISSPDQRLRDVVTNGLNFLSVEGPAFQNKKSCTTCHHGPITVWAQRDPAQLGFSIDDEAVNSFEEKLLGRFQGKIGKEDKRQWRHTLASFWTLGRPDDWNPADTPQITAALIDAFTTHQQEDGSWKPANQFSGQKRPDGEAALLQTMWNINALSRLEGHDKSLATHREKALEWVRKAPAPVSMDARVVRLLTEHRFGDATETRQLLNSLLEDQNDDGSWGWVAGNQGDAWATGITLYVLSFLGNEVPPAKIESAQSFLAESQTVDGSWIVPTKLNPEKHDSVISSYFGTAWSVMGLARTMGHRHK